MCEWDAECSVNNCLVGREAARAAAASSVCLQGAR